MMIALSLPLSAMAGPASQDAVAARESEIAAAGADLAALRDEVEAGAPNDIRGVEARARRLLRESRARLGPVDGDLKAAEERVAQLGPAPADGALPESEPIAELRARLTREASVLQGQRTRILAHLDDTGALLAEISAKRLTLLYAGLLERGPALPSPELWRFGAREMSALGADAERRLARWIEARRAAGGVAPPLALLAGALLLSIVMIGPIHRWMRRKFTRRLESMAPTPTRRVTVAGVKMLARLVPGIVGGLAVIETSRAVGLLGAEGVPVARAIWYALVAFLIAEGFASGFFEPTAPAWRVAAIDEAKGKRASILLLTLVAAFGVKIILVAIAGAAGGHFAFVALVNGVAAVALGALLFILSGERLWAGAPRAASAPPQLAGDKAAPSNWPLVRRLGQIVGVVIVAAALAGYVRLADFAASRLYYLALILAVAWFLRSALKELAGWSERRLRRGGPEVEDDRQILQFWFGAGVDFVLLLALAPAVLVLAGFGWRSVRDLVVQAFTGFRIGGVSISVSDILVALAVFFAVLAATRIAQGGLQKGVFRHSRVDPGVQNSLTTLLGYVGLVIALVAGVVALGVDLSNLAIIAGALSLGVGFGLQSIVNNFVSGLILLFERPIKVGDWIVTASGEGTVRRIGVRSTDIETFDRSSIIVPNSELVAQTVTNWTHRDRIGRITVAVGVSYGADAEAVRAILLQCAADHPLIVRYPEPFVVFKDFGDSALNFELRCFLRDISTGLGVKTDLRFSILKAFREAGVEIPFPQRDVHVRSTPGARRMRRNGEPARGRGAPPPVPRNEPETAEDE